MNNLNNVEFGEEQWFELFKEAREGIKQMNIKPKRMSKSDAIFWSVSIVVSLLAVSYFGLHLACYINEYVCIF